MIRLAGVVSVYVLIVLLAGTTSVGTNDTLHHDQLLHVILPHVHVLDGHAVSKAPRATASENQPLQSRQPGPAVGAGGGAAAAESGFGLTPPLPDAAHLSVLGADGRRVRDEDLRVPPGRAEPPPDPPPLQTVA